LQIFSSEVTLIRDRVLINDGAYGLGLLHVRTLLLRMSILFRNLRFPLVGRSRATHTHTHTHSSIVLLRFSRSTMRLQQPTKAQV